MSFSEEIKPKGYLIEDCPQCPHCKELTNPIYRWHPALDCWSCGKTMYVDDYNRTITERGEIFSKGELIESRADMVRCARCREEMVG